MGKTSTQVTAAPSPVVRRRELGALLRELRAEAGLTVEEVADKLLCSASKVSRMETGHRSVSRRDIRDLCDLYEVTDEAKRRHLATLAKESREPAWWQRYNLPPSFAAYVGLEAEAIRISDYQPGVLPGLLHTADYAFAIHQASLPKLDDSIIHERVELRLGRQAILTRAAPPPPVLRTVIDEAALHRVVGGKAVMGGQLQHVVNAAQLPNVTVQVLAYGAGAHPALDSKFILLEFTPPVPPVVYVEGLVGQLSLDKPNDVDRYEQVFDRLRQISLSEKDSIDLITGLAESYGGV